jgi:chemotaxis protein methyltransferase WspC
MNIPNAILNFLTVTLGIDNDAAGKEAINRAVTMTMNTEGISDSQDYEKLFLSSADARQRLTDAVVVGETWFFRDRGPFECLAGHVRKLREARPGEMLNILSAPCSTGEEPYSIVMTLLNAGLQPSAFRVDGVDISSQALDKARLAWYGKSAFRGNIRTDIAGFFEETPSGQKIVQQVVRQVFFHLDNLVSKNSLIGLGPFSVIFCRNLLIYLHTDARRQVFEKLDSLLLPGGLLFTGHTETNFWHRQGYIPIQWDRAFALTKPDSLKSPETVKAGNFFSSAFFPKPIQIQNENPTGFNKPAEIGKQQDRTDSAQTHVKHQKKPAKERSDQYQLLPNQQYIEARCLADRGDMDGALSLCRDYTRKIGPNADIYSLLGIIEMSRRNIESAEDNFLKALYLDPGHYESLVHISLIYRQKGNEQKALLYRERAERNAEMMNKELKESVSITKAKINENKEIMTNG